MFDNRFNTNDPLIEAVKQAQREGDLRRSAEAYVNEAFGVYSRNAVVREQLAAYDAAIEEAYKCMKEGDVENIMNPKSQWAQKQAADKNNPFNQPTPNPTEVAPNIMMKGPTQSGSSSIADKVKSLFKEGKPLDPVGHEDKDIDNDGDHDKTDKYLLHRRAVRSKAIKEEDLDEAKTTTSMGVPKKYVKGLSGYHSNAWDAGEAYSSDKVEKRAERQYKNIKGVVAKKYGNKAASHADKLAGRYADRAWEKADSGKWDDEKHGSFYSHPSMRHADAAQRAAERGGKRNIKEGSAYNGKNPFDPKDPSVQGSGDVTMDRPAKPVARKAPNDPSVQGSGDVTMGGKPARVQEKWEGSAEDKAEDKRLAKKHGMTLAQWERSEADKKHDAKEKLDEVSREMKSRYIEKAMEKAKEHREKGYTKGWKPKKGAKAEHEREMMNKRTAGISRAGKNMEEEAQLDEISADLARRYLKKVDKRLEKLTTGSTRAYFAQKEGKPAPRGYDAESNKKEFKKHIKGRNLAYRKLDGYPSKVKVPTTMTDAERLLKTPYKKRTDLKKEEYHQIDEVRSGQPSFRDDATKRARRIATAQKKAPKDPEFWKKVDADNEKKEKEIKESIVKRLIAKHMKEDSSFNTAQETGKSVSEAAYFRGTTGGYTIRKGDTLSAIARARGMKMSDIIKANPGMRDPNKIAAGGRLNLPGAKAAPAHAPAAGTAKPASAEKGAGLTGPDMDMKVAKPYPGMMSPDPIKKQDTGLTPAVTYPDMRRQAAMEPRMSTGTTGATTMPDIPGAVAAPRRAQSDAGGFMAGKPIDPTNAINKPQTPTPSVTGPSQSDMTAAKPTSADMFDTTPTAKQGAGFGSSADLAKDIEAKKAEPKVAPTVKSVQEDDDPRLTTPSKGAGEGLRSKQGATPSYSERGVPVGSTGPDNAADLSKTTPKKINEGVIIGGNKYRII